VNGSQRRRRLDKPTFLRRLVALGIGRHEALRITESEYSGEHLHVLRNGDRDDQRVMPHADGWVVTRRLDESDATYFAEREDAEEYALRCAKQLPGSGVIFYCRDGRVMRRVFSPRWR